MKLSTIIAGLVIIGIIVASILLYSYRSAEMPTPTVTVSPVPSVTLSPSSTATSTAPQTFNLKINESLKLNSPNLTLKPTAVAEDSRCPSNVQCIQAGTVRLRVQLGGLATTTPEVIFTLNTPIPFGANNIVLTAVTPAPVAGTAIAPADYLFTFNVR